MGLLGQLFYGEPEINPDLHVNDSGDYVDSTGKKTTVFTKPNMFQRIVSPEAQQAAQMNNQYSLAPLMAQQQNNIRRNLIGQNIAPLNSFIPKDQNGNPLLNPEQARALTMMGNDPTPGFYNQVGSDITAGNTGYPTVAGNTQTMGAINDYEKAKLTHKLYPTVAQTITNKALIDSGVTEQGVQDLMMNRGTIANQDAQQNFQSRYFNDPRRAIPFLSEAQPNGSVRSGLGISPYYTSPTSLEMQSLGGLVGHDANGKPSFTPVSNAPSGKTIGIPNPPALKYEVTNPTLQGESPYGPSIQQSAAKEHAEKVENARQANHDADKATIDTKLAALKEEKKKLQAKHINMGLLPTLGRAAFTVQPQDFPEGTIYHDWPIGAGNLIGNAGSYLKRKLWTGE